MNWSITLLLLYLAPSIAIVFAYGWLIRERWKLQKKWDEYYKAKARLEKHND